MSSKLTAGLLVASAIVILVLAAITTGAGNAIAGEMRPLLVRIVNTNSEPVPVSLQGTGDIQGEVTINNATSQPVPVAVQGTTNVAGDVSLVGTSTVGFSPSANTVKIDPAANTVQLSADADHPLAVQDVHNPRREPFAAWFEEMPGTGDAEFVVPGDKWAVVEFVTVEQTQHDGPAECFFPFVSANTNGVWSKHWIVPTRHEANPGSHVWIGSQAVRIYADPGSTVLISEEFCGEGFVAGRKSISGYLVDAP
jgi:hypothetical protein